MGDYYKLKKVLLILIIVSTILRIINNSKVFAADDVNSSIQNGNYVVQTDNHYLTLMSMAESWQDKYCWQLLNLLNNESSKDLTSQTAQIIYSYAINKKVTLYFYTNTNAARFTLSGCTFNFHN